MVEYKLKRIVEHATESGDDRTVYASVFEGEYEDVDKDGEIVRQFVRSVKLASPVLALKAGEVEEQNDLLKVELEDFGIAIAEQAIIESDI